MLSKIKIKGMSCQHCVMAVKKALSSIKGIENVEVSLERGEAIFSMNEEVDLGVIKKKIEETGYEIGE